jgi:hypothetical protein
MNPWIALLVMFLMLPLPIAAQEVTATMLEGSIRLVRGASVWQGAEGMRLRAGDIVESSDPGFLQFEFGGGTIVALGPASRMFLFRAGAGGAELVLLSGWLKGETSAKGPAFRYDTPLLGATAKDGTFVVHATPGGTDIFVESGSGNVSEMSPEGSWGHLVAAKAGQFFSRKSGRNLVSSGRPDSLFLEGIPRAFRDTLPSRLARFAGKKPVEPRRDHDVSYAEVQPWLTMGRNWRRSFVDRFEPRLKDADFRQAIDEHMSDHPEWDIVLHPEKYKNNPPPAPAASTNAPHGSN